MTSPRRSRASSPDQGGAFNRRSLLLGGLTAAVAGLGLTGCAPTDRPADRPAAAPTPPQVHPAVGSPVTSPVARPFPSKQTILAEFSTRVPKEWGLDATGVARGSFGSAVALTFDACGGPGGAGFDGALIGTLRQHRVPATLFVNKRWATANPGLLRDLAADPLLEIQNHGFRHLPLSVTGRSAYGIPGTRNLAEAYDEVAGSQELLTEVLGKAPKAFRPGTAYYDDVAAAMVSRCGLLPANFSVNADGGATFTPGQVAHELSRVKGGDVVISHFNQPASGTSAGYAAALPRMLERGLHFAHLSEVFSL